MHPKFTGVLYTIASIWKQPKCPLIDEWMNLCVDTLSIYIYTHSYTHTIYIYIYIYICI